jgi:uncharacterized repeat protein (TIGR04138 family)
MKCHTCGAVNPTIHLTGMIAGAVMEKRDYCTECFAVSKFADASVLAGARSFDSNRLKTELEVNMRKLETALGVKLETLLDQNPRFSREAYAFLFQGLHYAIQKIARDEQKGPRHVSARQLVSACEMCAKEMYGTAARTQVKAWGFETASDVGDLVFLMTEAGFLGKRAEDKREDFDGLPFFEHKPPG